MQINPYLSFDGRCEAAFKFYEKALGGKIVAMMTYGETPMRDQSPAEFHGKITPRAVDRRRRGADGRRPTPNQYQQPKGMTVTLGVDDPAEAERVFKALSENGTVTMPIAETFWARRFGMLVDQFGIPWMVNCERPQA